MNKGYVSRIDDAFRTSKAGEPLVKGLVRMLIHQFENQKTLLAVCPNSELVTRAAVRAASQAGAPLLLAATLNQVDLDGGYTGWTPQALVELEKIYHNNADRLLKRVP